MTTQLDSKPQDVVVKVADSVGVARRRLLRAGLSAVPVVLAVSGRSAMATNTPVNCVKGLSPMIWNSLTKNGTATGANCYMNSTNPTNGNQPVTAKTPADWKPANNGTVPNAWPATCVPYEGYPVVPGGGIVWSSGTKFNQIFAPTVVSTTKSFSELLRGSAANEETARYLCAAYLNSAKNFGPLSNQDVLDLATGKLGRRTSGVGLTEINLFLKQTWGA